MEDIKRKIIDFFQDYENPDCDDKYFEDTYYIQDIGTKNIEEAFKDMLINNKIEIIKN